MKSSSDIRKDNKKRIYKLMLDHQLYTKHQIAMETGLSVATCNTLLNDMENDDILTVSDEKELRGIGRGSSLYKINEEHESYLLISFYLKQEIRVIEFYVVSAIQEILYTKKMETKHVCLEDILEIIKKLKRDYTKIHQCIVSIPGVVHDNIPFDSDMKELETMDLYTNLKKVLNIPIVIESDMHVIACGYNKSNTKNNVVTIAGFHEKYYPGTVTMHKGQIISGFNGIAGMAGMLLDDVPTKCMIKDNCETEILKVLRSIIVFLNPNEIILYGNLVNETIVSKIQIYFEKMLPKKYIPVFKIVDPIDSYLLDGMFEIAVNNKVL